MRVAYNDSDDRAELRDYVQFNKYTYIHTYIYTLCGPGAARTSISRRVVSENGVAPERNIAAIICEDSSCNTRKKRTCNQISGKTCHGLLRQLAE